MMGTKARLFKPISALSLNELVPADHFYRYLDRVLDLAFVRDLVQDCYKVGVGRWAVLLRQPNGSLRVRPGHPDGAAGWGPLGSLYFSQALMLGIPVLYHGIWALLITENVGHLQDSYPRLPTTYIILFFALFGVEILAFVLPIWSFHGDMRRQKVVLTSEADKLSDRMLATQARIAETDDPDEAFKCMQQLTAMTAYYRALQTMPTWPVNTHVTVRFVLGNVGLLVPIAAQVFLPRVGF